jgi:murein DD-endopeptidase MepM/ murein hydrolase activator NlpD
MKKTVFLVVIFFTVSLAISQDSNYPADYFRSPLDIPLYLSGTFGELRSNHFHSGIDIKTASVEGKNVYAVADGYVSRIKISAGGYGKALYITHPNGTVSVYGHLQKFNKKIDDYVRQLQYKNESFEVETFPEKEILVVKKGEIVAFSGNSGSSGGPHLHFEIREESTQYATNPLLYKSIKVKDLLPPSVLELGIYPVDGQSLINGKNDTVFYAVEGAGKNYLVKGKPKIRVSGNISFGIRTHDLMNDIPNKNGVYHIEMEMDGKTIFSITMDKISFSNTRYINSLIDFQYYKKAERKLVRTQIDGNNQLFNYNKVENKGIVYFSDTLMHRMVFRVKDAYNNQSELKFAVFSAIPSKSYEDDRDMKNENAVFFEYDDENEFSENGIELNFPENAFYRSFWFQFSEIPGDSNKFSSVYRVHNQFTPVHKSFSVEIQPKNYPDHLKQKLFIAFSSEIKNFSYLGSEWDGQKLQASSNQFGYFTVLADTVSPVISPVNISNGKNISAQNTIKITIKDMRSGIKKYRATLNGNWILMEYDAKNNLLTYHFDDKLKKGENLFRIVVSDKLDNEAVYQAKLQY